MSFERLRARANRVKEECDLGALLQEYGYDVVPDRQREQQFACNLHGPDNKPSARLYGHNNTTYCWVCQKTRDPISYVQEIEQVSFKDAIEMLEKKLGLPSLPWSDDLKREVKVEDEIDEITRRHVSYEDERDRLRKILDGLTGDRLDEGSEGNLDAQTLLAFWEVFDRIDYGVARENWSEAKGAAGLEKLRHRVMTKLKEMA